jgi:hypothetical protein
VGSMPVRILVFPNDGIVDSNHYRDLRRLESQMKVLAGPVRNDHHYFTRSSWGQITMEKKSDRGYGYRCGNRYTKHCEPSTPQATLPGPRSPFDSRSRSTTTRNSHVQPQNVPSSYCPVFNIESKRLGQQFLCKSINRSINFYWYDHRENRLFQSLLN